MICDVGFKMMKRKPWVLILGGCTAWPLIYLVLHILFIVSLLFLVATSPGDRIHPGHTSPLEHVATVLTLVQYATVVLVAVLMVAYTGIVWCRRGFSFQKKISWSALILFGNALAMPFFFWHYLWKPKGSEANNDLQLTK